MIHVYKNNVIEGLRVLANYHFQKQALLNPTGPYMWIFHEDYEDIFEDTGLLEAWKAKQIVFSVEADKSLIDLAIAMKKIDSNLPDSVIVDLPEMKIVREMAATALQLMGQSVH